MIQGVSQKAYRVEGKTNYLITRDENGTNHHWVVEKTNDLLFDIYISADLISKYDGKTIQKNVHIEFCQGSKVDLSKYAEFLVTQGENPAFFTSTGFNNDSKEFTSVSEVEKMSKSKWNVVNPDDIIAQYGADTLRMYEMFLGPLEDSKPWDTKGIEGVYRFLQKFWRLFHEAGEVAISNDAPTEAELKLMHRTIKKITDDIERFSFNTSVSAFMICVNELQTLKCRKKAILEPLTRLLAPFAPHLTESCWQLLGGEGSVHLASFPTYEERYLVDDTFDYPVQENGKMRFNITLPKQGNKEELEQLAMQDEKMQQFLSTRQLKKIIVVPGRIINLVF
jgi:leucyl-tRNA synthetase